jgi:hypothetical protein
MDEQGRFVNVSATDFERLKSVAEDEVKKSYDQIPSASPARTITEGWRPKRGSPDAGSGSAGSPSNQGADGSSPLPSDGNTTPGLILLSLACKLRAARSRAGSTR